MTRIRRRTVLFGAGAGAAAVTVPYTPQPAPSGQARYGAAAQPATPALLPAPGEFTPLPLGSSPHNAFPSAVRLPDGSVRLMWRESTGHLDRDGRIMTTVGDPTTGVWTPATEIVLDTAQPGRDMRPGAISSVDGVLWLTYFWWQDNAISGAMAANSTDGGLTWGGSVRVDTHPWAAISSPIIRANGKLWTAFYTSATSSTSDPESAYAAWSSDNGTTWTNARIAVGASGNDFQEPWALAGANNSTVFVMRDGSWKSLASRAVDAAGTWTALNRNVVPSATGNSASVRATNGKIYLVYRHTNTRDAMLAVSSSNGVTWTTNPTPLLRAPANLGTGSLGMTYASPIDLGDGMIWCPIGLERSLDTSTLYAGWL